MPDNEKPEYTFVVAKQPDGRFAIGNIDGQDAERQPTVDDIFAACSIILRDIQVQQTVTGTVKILSQAAGAPTEQRTNSGLVVPEPTSKFKKVTRA